MRPSAERLRRRCAPSSRSATAPRPSPARCCPARRYPDPSGAAEAERRQAFELTRQAIGYRMLQLLALPLAELDGAALRQALVEIGAR